MTLKLEPERKLKLLKTNRNTQNFPKKFIKIGGWLSLVLILEVKFLRASFLQNTSGRLFL